MDRRSLYPLAALALLSACTADIPAPPTSIERITLAPQQARVAKGTSNKIKPSDNGKKPGTGGSGSSTMELSALLGIDGTTTIEASTGSLEEGTSNGTFSKMQLKLYVVPDTFTMNFNNLTEGYWSTADTRLTAGQTVQGKGTIKPPGSKSTDNVTVLTTVHLRPDLVVREVALQGAALRGLPTDIVAVVAEQNGDRGARADCILNVDGQDVDHADGIWVDAATEVECRFAHVFGVVGDHSVTVRADNVKPGDWDASNNTATITVKVVSPEFMIAHGSVFLKETKYITTTTTDTQKVGATHLMHRVEDHHLTRIEVYASDAGAAPQPFQRVSATIQRDGEQVFQLDAPLSFEWEATGGGARTRCYLYAEAQQYSRVCTWESATVASTTYSYFLQVGRTVFFGNDIYCLFLMCNVYDSPSSSNIFGVGKALGYSQGSVASLRLKWSDAYGDLHVIDRTLSLAYSDLEQHTSPQCHGPSLSDIKRGHLYVMMCQWVDRTGYEVQGYLNW